jgi:C-terminal processing protease CtpA/Prc
MPAVVRLARPHRVFLSVALALLGVLVGGCARSPTHDPAKAELLRQIREAYLFDVDVAGLELLSVPEIVARLDPDTRLVEMRRRMSLDFMRGFEPEGSVVDVRELGDGRGYLRLVFFGRRTLEDVRKALNGFTPPLCALTIDLRDNTGGSFEQALRLAELFLPPGAPLALYEGREGRALLYATGTAAPRQERLTLWLNARTASSAELFAGVLRWHHRAELVGVPTTGKRTVQQVVRLDQAHLLFLTTGRFLAPDGSPFGVHGLMPDRAYEGDDVGSLMVPCADPKPLGP